LATRKKTSKKKTNKDNIIFNKDLLGIVVISIGIIIMISLFNTKMGIVGQAINDACFYLMGFGGYFFPLAVISIGVMYLLDRFDKLEFRNTVAIIAIFISLLVVLDGINKVDLGFIDRIKNSIILSKANKGGGIIGSFFGFFFYKLFGSVGTYLVLSLLITVCLLILTNTKIKDIITKTNSIKHEKKDNIKKYKAQLSPEDLLEIPHGEIKIHDYSKNVQNDATKENVNSSSVKKETQNIDTEIKEKQVKFHNIAYKIPPLNLLKPIIKKKF
jgi:S-DNA-T family DNA segregation ATPase FtsK/SpoIIIE